jgi:hypothetical protein
MPVKTIVSTRWALVRVGLIIVAALLATAVPSIAQTTWTNASGGAWSNPSNWSSGLPTTSSPATISLAGTYTVTISTTESPEELLLNSASATLAINSASLDLAGSGSSGVSSNTAGTIALTSGNIFGSAGSLGHTFTNGGSIMAVSGSNSIYGNSNPFTFDNAGTINAAAGSSLIMGNYSTDSIVNTGTITSSGATVYLGNNIASFDNSSGTVNALSGGTVNFGNSTVYYPGSSLGTINASGSGVVNLIGNFNFPQLAGSTINAAGGTINIKGVYDQSSDGGAALLPPASGTYTLAGGTILEGNIDGTNGALTYSNAGGILNDVAVVSITMPVNTSFSATQGTTFGGTSTFAGGDQIQTLGGGTSFTIFSNAIWNGGISIYQSGGSASTANNLGTINETTGSSSIYGNSNVFNFNNSGTITTTSGVSLVMGNYSTDLITNTGTITANGGTVYLGNNISKVDNSAGTINALGGSTINFGNSSTAYQGSTLGTVNASGGSVVNFLGNMTYTFLDASTINGAGGTLNLKAQLDQTGDASPLAPPTTGIYTLSGGTILGGSITGSTALTYSNAGGTLNGVAVTSISMPLNTSFGATGSTTFSGTSTFAGGDQIQASGSGTPFVINSGAIWNGGISIYQSGSGPVTINNLGTINETTGSSSIYGNSNVFNFNNSGTITTTSGVSLVMGNYSTDLITNTGTITANGGTVYLGNNISKVDNSGGTVDAIAGGTVNFGSTSTSIQGASLGNINVSGGGILNLLGNLTFPQLASSVIHAAGGTLYIRGTYDQSSDGGAALLPPASGTYTLAGGTIFEGNIDGTNGALTYSISGGTFNDVAVQSLSMPTSTYLTVTAGTTFGGTNTFAGGDEIMAQGGGTAFTISSGAVWNGGITIYQTGGSAATINNLGTINETIGSSSIYGNSITFNFNNLGALTAGAGTSLSIGAYAADTIMNPGTIEANGAGANITIGNGASVITNYSSSTLTGGTWIAAAGGTLTFENTSDSLVTIGAGTTVDLDGSSSVIRSNPSSSLMTIEQTLTTNNGTLEVLSGRNFASTSAGIANSGTIQLGGGTLTAATLANNSGAVLSGFGTFHPTSGGVTIGTGVNLSPGSATAGNYVGQLSFATTLAIAGSGTMTFDISNAGGAAGTGYDTVAVTGAATITASPGTPFNISIESVNPGTGLPGLATFNAGTSYQWTLISAASISGFSSTDFTLVDSSFSNSVAGGNFYIVQSGNTLQLDFTPVPEPSSWALMAVGLGMAGLLAHRAGHRRT